MGRPDKPPFIANDLRLGMSLNTRDLSPDLRLSEANLNLSTGIQQGLGPRPGCAPLPGHNMADTDGLTSADFPGQQLSEESVPSLNGDGLRLRRRLFGIAKIPLGILEPITTATDTSDIKRPNFAYAWIVTQEYQSGSYRLWVVLNSKEISRVTKTTPITLDVPSSDFSKGFYLPYNFGTSINRTQYGWTYYPPGSYSGDPNETFRDVAGDISFLSFAWITVQGGTYPQPYLFGPKAANAGTPDADDTVIPNFVYGLTSSQVNGGVLPDIMRGLYKKGQRTLVFYNLDGSGLEKKLARSYIYQDQLVSENTYYATYEDMDDQVGMVLSGSSTAQEGRFDGTAPTYANINAVLVYDPAMQITANYSAVCVAVQKALIYIIQDWFKPEDGNPPHPLLVDPTQAGYGTHVVRTTLAPYYDGTNAIDDPVGFYNEYGVQRQTRWRSFPGYNDYQLPLWDPTGNTATVTFGDSSDVVYGNGTKGMPQICRLPENSGILRSNTSYELCYSVFDKRLGFETNLSDSAFFRTGGDDFVGITLFIDAPATPTGDNPPFYQYCPSAMVYCPVDPKLDGGSWTTAHLNWMELRFYYREYGSNTWLPALFIDANYFFFYPNHRYIAACTGNVVGLPGGQPGDYIDHSPLPQDTYTCVVTYQNRTFWISQKQCCYSAYNNILEYPIRNTVPAPSGEFLGAKVHTFPGQAQQSSRLLLYGTDQILVARFTGVRTNQAVQVDPETVVALPVDGSDLVVDYWSTNTAFSYRSAVIAEGLHVYWGQYGIFMDDGVNRPKKISRDIEPLLFNVYDKGKVAEIHGTYSETMREIWWFYRIPNQTTKTGILIFSLDSGGFMFGEIDGIVDSTCQVDIKQTGAVYGQRTVVVARVDDTSEVNRGYFMDFMNRSGDMKPGTEFLVKEVATLTTTTRRLTFADGHGDLSSVAVGDRLATDQVAAYTGDTTQTDLYTTVTAVDSVAGTVDIELPETATLDPATYAYNTYFPLYFENINAYSFQLETQYWAPAGLTYNGFFAHLHLFFKYQGKPTNLEDNIFFENRAPMASDWGQGKEVVFTDNSDQNCQMFVATELGNGNMEGQGIKFRITGKQLGSSWVLQYVAAYPADRTFDFLKTFEV